eukprot:4435101-Ditylum_brightwellii.AAC.1
MFDLLLKKRLQQDEHQVLAWCPSRIDHTMPCQSTIFDIKTEGVFLFVLSPTGICLNLLKH